MENVKTKTVDNIMIKAGQSSKINSDRYVSKAVFESPSKYGQASILLAPSASRRAKTRQVGSRHSRQLVLGRYFKSQSQLAF
jgi:hypothetical protein